MTMSRTRACRRKQAKMRARRRLRMESLEGRRLLAAIPAVSINAPAEVMIGETADLEVTFDNVDPNDPGFGPFVDVYLPRNGADGVAGVGTDGVSYVPGSANYLGAPVTANVYVFPDDGGGTGTISHPYAVDITGAPLNVVGTAGDQLLVFELPFGSFTASQPPAAISFQADVSDLADLSTPLSLRARGGFRYGNDELDNPTTGDVSLVSQAVHRLDVLVAHGQYDANARSDEQDVHWRRKRNGNGAKLSTAIPNRH